MVMSRDPDFKFENCYFSPNSVLNFRKVTKFGGNWLKNKSYMQKTNWGGGGDGKHPLIGLKLSML